MKTSLDHLPAHKQRELGYIVSVLQREFVSSIEHATQKSIRDGRILKIILFGSHARGDWVNDKSSGYVSDFDILVVVNRERFTDVEHHWLDAFDILDNFRPYRSEVNVIVHSLGEVNTRLSQGQYFFADIRNEGVLLYEALGSKRLKEPQPLTPDVALSVAEEHYENWLPNALEFFEGYGFFREKKYTKKAAFLLHQTVESLYHGHLLIHTNYTPGTHNIKFLRSQCEAYDRNLISCWPRNTKAETKHFNKLKDAYVKARYSKHFRISEEELDWLEACVRELMQAVEVACQARLEALRGMIING